MSARLTEVEVENLAALVAALPLMPSERLAATRRAATTFSDALRQDMGDDVDDITLGRALLHIGTFVSRIATNAPMTTLANSFLIAALDMTALERDEIPPHL